MNAKEKRRVRARIWRENNPEKHEKQKAYYRQWYLNNKDRVKDYVSKTKEARRYQQRKNTLKQHGLTFTDFDRLFDLQARVCAACGSKDPHDKRGWVVDHNHKNNRVRAILCGPCNRTIGHAKEDIRRLRSCIFYLEIANDHSWYS